MLRAYLSPLLLLVLAQASFICIGILFLDFSISFLSIGATLIVAHLTDILVMNIQRMKNKEQVKIFFSLSTLAAALGILLFFRAVDPAYFALAAALAVASKHLLLWRGRHIFNPSNFAIVVLVFSFSSATTIEFTQWGTNVWLHIGIAIACFCIAYFARAIATTLSFLVSYTVLLLVTTLYIPQIFSIHHFGLLGPSLVLFASFMITDPKTSPQEYRSRILHGISIAALYFFLETIGVRYALFVSSFLVTILNMFGGEIFAWVSTLRPRIAFLPRNSFTFALSAALCLFTFMTIAIHRQPKFDAWPVSIDFLLHGVESGAVSCNREPIFSPHTTGVLEVKARTEGAAWGDYDADGWDDLYVANGSSPSRLYRNNSGEFFDVTESSGLPLSTSSGGFFVDYDNDRSLDLIVLSRSSATATSTLLRVFHNDGKGNFTDRTQLAGFFETPDRKTLSTISFADYDKDGDLDLLLADTGSGLLLDSKKSTPVLKSFFDPRYQQSGWLMCDPTQIDKLMPEVQKLAGSDAAPFLSQFKEREGCVLARYSLNRLSWNQDVNTLPHPNRLLSASLILPGKVRLFENRGGIFIENKAFEKTMNSALVLPKAERARVGDLVSHMSGIFYQPVSFDYDADGWTDIFLSIDTASSMLLRNTGGLTFTDVTEEAGVNYAGTGMGVDVADINHDFLPDLFVDNVREDYLYMNTGTAFSKVDDPELGRIGVGWGAAFLDYDLDGWDDLYVANGDIFETETSALSSIARPYFRNDNLYRNIDGTLVDVTGKDLCPDRKSGRALAVSDFDNDGDPDVFVGNYTYSANTTYSGNVLLKNTVQGHKSVAVKLEGTESNSMGIGALVRVEANGYVQTKQVLGGSSFYSQNSQKLIFGLGTSTAPVTISVVWPSGKKTELQGAQPGTVHILKE